MTLSITIPKVFWLQMCRMWLGHSARRPGEEVEDQQNIPRQLFHLPCLQTTDEHRGRNDCDG